MIQNKMQNKDFFVPASRNGFIFFFKTCEEFHPSMKRSAQQNIGSYPSTFSEE